MISARMFNGKGAMLAPVSLLAVSVAPLVIFLTMCGMVRTGQSSKTKFESSIESVTAEHIHRFLESIV